MTNRFVKSSIHFHVIRNPMFNKLYDFALLCFTLYNFCHFSIFFIFYNHLFIDVYARNSWCVRLSRLRGSVTGTGMPPYPAAREAPRSRCDLTLSLSKAPHPLPATACSAPWKGLHQKGAAERSEAGLASPNARSIHFTKPTSGASRHLLPEEGNI